MSNFFSSVSSCDLQDLILDLCSDAKTLEKQMIKDSNNNELLLKIKTMKKLIVSIKEELRKRAENNKKDTWKLKNRKVQISRSGSGQMENDIYKIRILWSPKLGLQFWHSFKTKEDAEKFAVKITQKGVIRQEFWEKTFHPHSGWASAHYSD